MTFPGKTNSNHIKFELDYWEKFGGDKNFDLHHPVYQKIFPMEALDYGGEVILDVGSRAISVFEKLTSADANIVPIPF